MSRETQTINSRTVERSLNQVTIIVVSGSGGLIGAQAVTHFASDADLVVGIDNNMRAQFFGPDASTQWVVDDLQERLDNYRHYDIDVRNADGVRALFAEYGADIALIVHTAAQPSHDWAARDPQTDFGVNANGTLNLLEAARQHCPDAVFIFTSTNKVYGDTPNPVSYTHLTLPTKA